jgi:hypothetical protein
MPSCRITNHTPHTLNVSLKQVTALHFQNEVLPGMTVKFRVSNTLVGSTDIAQTSVTIYPPRIQPGKVWFTIEALIDDGPDSSSRYSVLKSAATIALISVCHHAFRLELH